MGAVLSVAGLRHRRGKREVLRVDRLEIAAGERLGLLGLNGAGKTTLLRLLAAIDRPTVGEVRVDDVATTRGGPELRRRLAYAPQRPVLLSTTVRHNVELPLRYRRVPSATRRARAAAALARLGAEHLIDRPARSLSGGEAQRVSLARALVCAPDALLLDEPAAALDTPTRAAFFADVERALEDRSTTVVLVSHRAEEVLALADRVAVIVDGEIHQAAPSDDLVTNPADAAVARLIGYETVVEAEIDDEGNVLAGGRHTGLTTSPGSRFAVPRHLGGRGSRTRPPRRHAPGRRHARHDRCRTPRADTRRRIRPARVPSADHATAACRRRGQRRHRPRSRGHRIS